jgi:hypothetical protein
MVPPLAGFNSDPHHKISGSLARTVVQGRGTEKTGLGIVTSILEVVILGWPLGIEAYLVPPPSIRQLAGCEDVRGLARNPQVAAIPRD